MTLLRSLSDRSSSTALSWCACKGDDDELQKALEAVEKEQACSKKLESRQRNSGGGGSGGGGKRCPPQVLEFLADLSEPEREGEKVRERERGKEGKTERGREGERERG